MKSLVHLSVSIMLLAAMAGCQSVRELRGVEVHPRWGKTGEEATSSTKEIRVSTANWGQTPDGRAVTAFTVNNAQGLKAVIMDFGATLLSLEVPDRQGAMADIVLGHDSVAGYAAESTPYLGATVGRYANRIANARFQLDGQTYTLAATDPPHSLHGGKLGFHKALWKGEPTRTPEGSGVRFTYTSADGEEGYPGELKCAVTYILTDDNELKIVYAAETNKKTVVNLTHHSYFNLGGHTGGDVLGHVLELNASRYTPGGATLIPTGVIAPVKGTPFDFTRPTPIGERINEVAPGYDLNYVLDKASKGLSLGARVTDPASGRTMEVYTTEPGLQFYTGHGLNVATGGKGGAVYTKYSGFCLEAQKFPDTPNQPSFPAAVLEPGEKYTQTTIHRFLK